MRATTLFRGSALASLTALAVFAGCGETDPNEINNSVTTGQMEPVAPLPAAANAAPPASYPGSETKGGQPATADADTPAIADADTPATEVLLSADELAKIAELPEDEQEIAKAQKVCPVSNQNLGSMGKPLKVEHDGQVAFLCCPGCKADFEADPAAVMAKAKK